MYDLQFTIYDFRKVKISSFFVLLFSFFFFLSNAQLIITGTAKHFSSKEIRLYRYKDYITKSKLLVETTLISAEGKFKFSLPENISSSTFYAMFKIENFVASMYVEPNSEYEISISIPDSVQFYDDRINYIDLKIISPENEELNSSLQNFYSEFDNFVQKNYPLFLNKSAQNEVDSFKIKILNDYGKTENDYFKNSLKYNLASLDLMTSNNRSKIYSEYISTTSAEYNNDAFMNFFNEFYSKPFESFSEQYLREMLVKSINEKKSYQESVKVLSNEKLLENEKIRELVLLKGLYENYNKNELEKKSIQLVLKETAVQSNFAEIREIAMNILNEVGKIGVGAKAPDFSLYDKRGNLVKLFDFRGKYVYLDFWATWCIPCLKEMPAMEELHKKYAKDVVFISISIDKDLKTMQKFLNKKKNYNWIFLHYGNYPEVKELYNILAIPQFFLIDTEGILIQSPAYRPSGKIEETFVNILNEKQKNRKQYEKDW